MDIEAEILKLQAQIKVLQDQVVVTKTGDHCHGYKIPGDAKEHEQITVKTEGTYGI